MIKLELPIYYTFQRKTKKDTKILVGMNWYRNAHFRNSNQIKKFYHELIFLKVLKSQRIKGSYQVEYLLYPSNANCDLMNVVSVIDKFLNDNIKFYKSMTAGVKEIDKYNPRIEIKIIEIGDGENSSIK